MNNRTRFYLSLSYTFLFLLTLSGISFSQKKNIVLPVHTVSLKEAAFQPGIGLQSFAVGRWQNYILLAGGRTNGFHGTDGTDSSINFPSSFSNRKFIVHQLNSNNWWTTSVPAPYVTQLSSTNMQDCQRGNYLLLCGGYGKDSTGNYTTFPNLVAIKLSEIIPAIVKGDTSNLGQFIGQTTNPEMAVTGGELKLSGGFFYLVMGQNFQGPYTNPSSQTYTVQIKKFAIGISSQNVPVAKLVARYYDQRKTDSTSRFHRRDLNVVSSWQPIGLPGITVYGGVFTPVTNGPYRAPVYINMNMNGTTTVTVDGQFKQRTNQYACASILIYDPSSQVMATTLLGGISLYVYRNYSNPYDTLHRDPAMPFTRGITTLFKLPGGQTYESVVPTSNCLKEYLGAESKFVPVQSLLLDDTEDILDFSKIVADPNQSILIGYLLGGIVSTAPQSSTINPTFTNTKLYEVHLTRQDPGGTLFKK